MVDNLDGFDATCSLQDLAQKIVGRGAVRALVSKNGGQLDSVYGRKPDGNEAIFFGPPQQCADIVFWPKLVNAVKFKGYITHSYHSPTREAAMVS